MTASDTGVFGALLRQHRLKAGLSQEALAEHAGLSADAVAALERGRRTRPHPETVLRLAAALALSQSASDILLAAATRAKANTAVSDSQTEPQVAATPTIPTPLTALIGREREEEMILAILQDGTRLVTLIGPGGVGKTRLALAIAARARTDFACVCFVALAPVMDADLVLVTVAQALGVRESRDRRLMDRLADTLRDRRVLLVLDNCEQVVAAAPQVADLLALAPGLTILTTSRERLQLTGEQTVPVPPLPMPVLPTAHGTILPAAYIRSYPAIRLFVERARAIHPEFTLTEANAATVAAICHHLDGLPLAIELAAARIRVLSPAAQLARLEHRLQLLTGGARDRPERHRTLRGTIDWSYDLLDAREQQLFRRLAVFARGGTLEAIEQVSAQVGDASVVILDGLESLLDKSLIICRAEEADGETPRFAMLETIREYAAERLAESGEEDTLRLAHAAHYLTLVEHTERGDGATDGATVWRARITAELGNVRAALGWAIERGEEETGLRLAAGMAPFWWATGALYEGRRWIEAALTLPSATQRLLRARVLREAGTFAAAQGDITLAIQRYEESRALLGPNASPVTRAILLGDLAMATFQQGDGTRALALLYEALALQEDAGDDRRRAGTYNRLGLVESQYGDVTRGTAHFEMCITLARRHGDRPILAAALNNFGNLLMDRGEIERAAALFAESIALRRALEDKVGLPISLHSGGEAARRGGDLPAAATFFAESLTLRSDLGDRRGMARCLESMAAVVLARGGVVRAARLLGASGALRTAMGAAIYPAERADIDATTRAVRAQLGAATEAALAAGRVLTLDAMVQEALAATSDTEEAETA